MGGYRNMKDASVPAKDLGGAYDRGGLAWAVFEWARNPYYFLVVIYIFAPYFARDVIGANLLASGELDGFDAEKAQQIASAKGQATVASVVKWAGIIAGLTAPILGAALDRGGRRKPLIAVFLAILALMSALLWWTQPGDAGLGVTWTMIVLVIAYATYTYSEVTHNSMLADSARLEAIPAVSGLGLALGSLASTILMIGIVLMFALPGEIQWPFEAPLFGLDLEAYEHYRLAGPATSLWLLVFIAPFFLYARDHGTLGASWRKAIREGTAGVINTIRRAADHREAFKYLIARTIYADGMAALFAIGATYVALFLGWGFMEMIVYAIYASAFGFFGGLLGGWLDRRIGCKNALVAELTVMLLVLVFMLSITRESIGFGLIDSYEVWDGPIFQTLSDIVYLAVVALIAIFATACISSSRSMLLHVAPPDMRGEFFGLYAIAGTITVWLGPLMVEIFTNVSNSQRIGMSAISLLFIAGLMILLTVKTDTETGAVSAPASD